MNAAFFSLSYFLQLWTAQGCAWPQAVFLLSCPSLWSVAIAAMAKLCDKSLFSAAFPAVENTPSDEPDTAINDNYSPV